MRSEELLRAVIAYAGPLADPRIGWVGTSPSDPDLFQCERCGQENLDCTKIPHSPDCSAAELIRAMNTVAANDKVSGGSAMTHVSEMTDTEKALAYYKNGALHQAPPYVPARVRLHARVRGDGPWHSTFADAGEHDCESNKWGAISVRATNGSLLGVKPAEFEVVSWRPND